MSFLLYTSLVFFAATTAQDVDTLSYLKQRQKEPNRGTGISIKLLTPLTFPQLKQTPATWEGALCHANGRNNKKTIKTSLCPGVRGYRAEFEITGQPKSFVDVEVFGNETKQGLSFTIENKAGGFTQRVRIKKSGVGTFSANGTVTLSNAYETGTGTYTFSYSVTAVYQ